MKTINVEGGGFPGTSKTWRFIAEMIAQNSELINNIAGDNVIVSGLQPDSANPGSGGLVVLGGELYPVLGGAVPFENAYLSITEDVEQTQYLKDEDGDGSGDLIDTYFERYAVVTSQSVGNVKLSDLDRLSSLKEMSKRIPPVQTALPYFGSIAGIPEGWQLCDGSNGTPDLSGKFVVGYDPSDDDYNAIGKAAGEKEHTLLESEMPQHNHTGIAQSNGAHTHSGTAVGPYNGNPIGGGFDGGGNAFRTQPITINSGGAHSHNLSINNAGQSQAHENRPPYYTLAYIAYTGI